MENTSLGYPYSQQQQNYYQQPRVQYVQPGNTYSQQPMTPQIPPRVVDYVQGELAATIYPVAYGQEVTLIDMDDNTKIYRKMRDNTGKLSPLQKFNLVPVEDVKQEPINMSEYVKSSEILDIISEAVESEVEKKLSQISFKTQSKKGSDD